MPRLLLLLLWGLLSTGSLFARDFQYAQGEVVTPSGARIQVQVADTPEKRSLGLGERDQLSPGTGMLFVFPASDRHTFWMKGMRFPIDILWIQNQRIVHIARSVPPPKTGERPVTLRTPAPANLVLELPAQASADYGLEVGQSLRIQF